MKALDLQYTQIIPVTSGFFFTGKMHWYFGLFFLGMDTQTHYFPFRLPENQTQASLTLEHPPATQTCVKYQE